MILFGVGLITPVGFMAAHSFWTIRPRKVRYQQQSQSAKYGP